MDTSQLQAFSDQLTTQGVLFCFNGPFSHSLIEEFGRALRKHLQDTNEGSGAISDVFSVYIEQAQNIQRYVTRVFGDRAVDGKHNGIVVIARDENRFSVCSGNRMLRADRDGLSARLRKVQTSDKAALKAMYKEQLKSGTVTDGGGAGLGFIGMARVASEPLDFRIDDTESDEAFFSLRVFI